MGLNLGKPIEEIFTHNSRRMLRVSLFEEVFERDREKNFLDKHLLEVNRRSVWIIAQLVSEVFYEGKLKHRGYEPVSEDAIKIVSVYCEENNTASGRVNGGSDSGYESYLNYGEISAVLLEVDEVLGRYHPEDIFILSPYKAQIKAIERFISLKAGLNDFELRLESPATNEGLLSSWKLGWGRRISRSFTRIGDLY